MKKLLSLLILVICLSMFTYAQEMEYKQFEIDIDSAHAFTMGGYFAKVSNNGEYAVGFSGMTQAAFMYSRATNELICLNKEWDDEENGHLWSAAAYDASNGGIVVGRYTFVRGYSLPAYYNVKTKVWTRLPLSPDLSNPEESGSLSCDQNGAATSITSDGRVIGGYIYSKLDNSKGPKVVALPVACQWVRVNDDAENPVYELQLPIETDHTQIMTQGDFAFHMSDDGKWMGGRNTSYSGCFNPAIWENVGEGEKLERTLLRGRLMGWDYDGETSFEEDTVGASVGQYFWTGNVNCISTSGEWIVGEHSYNGTGYADTELPSVGFKYNTITGEMTDSLFGGIPSFVFDDGEVIFGSAYGNNILGSSDDKTLQAGSAVIAVEGIGALNIPYLRMEKTASDYENAELNYTEVVFDVENEHMFAMGGYFTKVSPKGKFAVGFSEINSTAFYYDVTAKTLTCLNPEMMTEEADYSAKAYDATDEGIIVGRYSFEANNSVPAYYNVNTKLWTALELVYGLTGQDTNGEATSISADGKYISGYINAELDDANGPKPGTVTSVPCMWVRTNEDAKNPVYELQNPLELDHTLIHASDRAYHMSDDATILAGISESEEGAWNIAMWENIGAEYELERTILIGKECFDYDGLGDAIEGQYFWYYAAVNCISPNGEWIVGSHNFNGTGYSENPNPASVGFKYNTVTGEMIDTLFGGIPAVVFNNGDIIYGATEIGKTNILCSTEDRLVQGGVKIVDFDGNAYNVPFLQIGSYVADANEYVNADLDINLFVNNKNIYVSGEFTGVEIYTVCGSLIATFENVQHINCSNYSNGVYLVRVVNGNEFTTKKVVL